MTFGDPRPPPPRWDRRVTCPRCGIRRVPGSNTPASKLCRDCRDVVAKPYEYDPDDDDDNDHVRGSPCRTTSTVIRIDKTLSEQQSRGT